MVKSQGGNSEWIRKPDCTSIVPKMKENVNSRLK